MSLIARGGFALSVLGTALSYWMFGAGCSNLEQCNAPSTQKILLADEAVEKFLSEAEDICRDATLLPMLSRSPCAGSSITRGHLNDNVKLSTEDARLVRLHAERLSQAVQRLCTRLDGVGEAVAARRAATYRQWDRQRQAELNDLLKRNLVTWGMLNMQRKEQRRRLEVSISV